MSAFSLRHRAVGLTALLVLIAILAVYVPGLGNALIFDDERLRDGTVFNAYGGLLPLQPRLLSYGSFVWLQTLLGESWAWQRGFNIVLHAGASVALFLFLRELLATLPAAPEADADETTSTRRAAALVAAAWFAVHPVAVYGVAYLIQRSIVMATLFMLLACWAYVRGLRTHRPAWLAAALGLFVVAVLSKEHAVTTAALALPLYVFVARPQWKRLALTGLVVAVLLGVATYVLSLRYGSIIGSVAFDDTSKAYVKQLSALRPDIESDAYLLSIFNQMRLFFGYGLLWAIPNIQWMAIDLRPAFPLTFGSATVIGGAIGYIGLMVLCAWTILKRKDAWGLAALLVLCAQLLFATEFATTWVQDPFVLYRSYLWAPMLAGLLALGLSFFQRKTIYSMGAIIVVVLSALAWERVQSLHDAHSAWSDAADKVDLHAPDNAVGRWRPFLNRGAHFLERESADNALRDFDLAVRLGEPMGSAQMNKGVALQMLRRYPEALTAFNAAEALGFTEGGLYYHRAGTQAAMRQFPAAFKDYSTALQKPQAEEIRRRIQVERAQVALPAQQYDTAIADLKALLTLQPDNDRLKVGLGMAYLGKQQFNEALALFNEILARQPNAKAHYGRAEVLARQGKTAEAQKSIQQALELEPRHPGFQAFAAKLGNPASPGAPSAAAR